MRQIPSTEFISANFIHRVVSYL